MTVAASKWKYKLSYEQYCGGVLAIGKFIYETENTDKLERNRCVDFIE
jgi:hypothetical protein